MREILFRGKQFSNGEWVEGCFLDKNNIGIFYDDTEESDCTVNIFSVNSKTIGQYTGLTDRYNKKIFEGDIVSIPFEEDKNPYEENAIYRKNAEVYFDTERCGWYFRCSDDSLSIREYDNRDIVVIGNIHDNSELLERRNDSDESR